MKYFMWSVRAAFCKHEWHYDEIEKELPNYGGSPGLITRTRSVIVSATCKKCGWHRKYKKF